MDKNSTIALSSGAKMPVIGFGTWQLPDAAQVVNAALNLGYRLIDTSGNYGTQPGIAAGINRANVTREALYLTTKVENDEDPMESLQQSVHELSVASVDLALIHWPPASGAGEDLWQRLIEAKSRGLTRDIGVCNYPPRLIEELVAATGEWPVVVQVEWSPFGFKPDFLEYAKEHGLVVQAWSPLTHASQLGSPPLAQLAEKYHKSPAQIVLRWDLQLGVVPLPKAHSVEHLAENIDIFDFKIREEDMQKLSLLNSEFSTFGRLHY